MYLQPLPSTQQTSGPFRCGSSPIVREIVAFDGSLRDVRNWGVEERVTTCEWWALESAGGEG